MLLHWHCFLVHLLLFWKYGTGIWGGKGQGKSFQTELVFQAMGIEPVIMSAGELESERAGMMGFLHLFFHVTTLDVAQVAKGYAKVGLGSF